MSWSRGGEGASGSREAREESAQVGQEERSSYLASAGTHWPAPLYGQRLMTIRRDEG